MAHDVFLSYAHKDDQVTEGIGFITRLKQFLENEGSIVYGKKIRVWKDDKIRTGAYWKNELLDQLWLSRVFIPVISPSWFNSSWTQKEWNEKFEQIRDDFRIGNQSRILPIGYELTAEHLKFLSEVRVLQMRHQFSFESNLQTALLPFLRELAAVLKLLD